MRILKLLPILGILLFGYIIWSSGPDKIADAFLHLNYYYLLLAVLLNGFIIILKGIKWKRVINVHGFDYTLKDSIKVWCTGSLASSVTPGRVGDLIRVFYLENVERNFGKRLSTVIIDRVLDLVSVLIFSAIGIVMINYWFGSYFNSLGFLVVFIVLFFFLVYFIMSKRFTKIFAKPVFNFFMPQKYKARFKSGFNDFYISIDELKSKRVELGLVLGFTMIIWIMSILQVYMISQSLNMSVSYWYLLAIVSMVAIVELIPVSVMGLGTREAFFIFSLSLVGVSSQLAIAFSVLYLVIGFWLAGILGFVFWFKHPVKLKI